MASHRTRPARRRQRGLTAKAIVLGTPATAILHQGRTAHLLPVKASDNRSRYATGQRLAVKEMVPGATACHVIVTAVHGPRDAFTLAQVTRQTAKDLGHPRLDTFWRYWIANHDQAWMGRAIEAGTDTDHEIARRFHARWHDKLAWLLRFTVDTAAPPRLLAARSDELYVTSDAMALHGEKPALTDDEWKLHIGPQSRYREQDRLAELRVLREAQAWPLRIASARATAQAKGYDITSEVRLFNAHIAGGKQDKARRQLQIIEARVFPAAA